MSGEEELQKLEKSIHHAAQMIKELVDEKDHWKSLYAELSGQIEKQPVEGAENKNLEAFQQMEKLVQEVHTFRSKFEATIAQLETLKKKIYLKLNH